MTHVKKLIPLSFPKNTELKSLICFIPRTLLPAVINWISKKSACEAAWAHIVLQLLVIIKKCSGFAGFRMLMSVKWKLMKIKWWVSKKSHVVVSRKQCGMFFNCHSRRFKYIWGERRVLLIIIIIITVVEQLTKFLCKRGNELFNNYLSIYHGIFVMNAFNFDQHSCKASLMHSNGSFSAVAKSFSIVYFIFLACDILIWHSCNVFMWTLTDVALCLQREQFIFVCVCVCISSLFL